MKKLLLLFTVCLCVTSWSQTIVTNQGTRENVIPTTSALWRSILPTENPFDALELLGLTNVGGVKTVSSATADTTIGQTTNLDQSVNIVITNGAIASALSPDLSVSITLFTNLDGSTKVYLSANTTNLLQFVRTYLTTNVQYDNVAIRGHYVLTPYQTGASQNLYWLDFGRTNALGQALIYADLVPTNDVLINGITNCSLDGSLSFYVFAVGTNRNVLFPTNLFLTTNQDSLATTSDGLGVSGQYYSLLVSNHEWLRFTVRSNVAGLEPQWEIKP